MKTMTDELKPCPFCGGEAIMGIACHVHEDYAFRVECRECKIVTPFYDTEAEAIEAWNKRVERTKGEWIEYPDCLQYDDAYADDQIVCSVCHHVFSILDNCTEEFDFCPHCGADMRGE